jgi:hypothetical protein
VVWLLSVPVPPYRRTARPLPNCRVYPYNDVGEIRLAWCARMVAILEIERPVGEGSHQVARRGVQRISTDALGEPYPRLSARLVHPQFIEATPEYPERVGRPEEAETG